jgi:peptide/nickel transport system ATP-binding protein
MILAPLIELRGVSKRFARPLDLAEKLASKLGALVNRTVVHAVDRVDLRIASDEAVGLVGESGCGKSTLGRIISALCEPSEGTVLLHGVDRTTMTKDERRKAQLAVQMMFQDAFASLNPRFKVRQIVGEAPCIHRLVTRANLDMFIDDILQRVGLDATYKGRYPHQLSGGQRQRIGIARALAVNPEFVVCDEPVAALDVSIQAQIINLFVKLREEIGLSYLFISHDLGVVEHIADRIYVMYLGRIVESAPTEALFAAPNHPYTQALLDEIPRFEQRRHRFAPVRGEVPSAITPPAGCHFHPRCPHAMDRCRIEAPMLKEIAPGRASACHLNDRA